MLGDLKAELDEILSSSEFRGLAFELDQMRYIFNRGPQFTYRTIARLFDKSKSHVHTLLTAHGPVEETLCGGKVLLLEKRKGPSLLREDEEKTADLDFSIDYILPFLPTHILLPVLCAIPAEQI